MNKLIKIIVLIFFFSCIAEAQDLSIQKENYQAVDKNNDNCITLEEIQISSQARIIAPPGINYTIPEIIDHFDMNQDGCVTFEEYSEKLLDHVDQYRDFKDAYKHFDRNDDGCVSYAEVKKQFNYFARLNVLNELTQQFMDNADTNNDECVSFMEFVVVMRPVGDDIPDFNN